MPFLTESEPARGEPHPVAPGIRRVVAPNPSVMTYWGTNTYLIDAALTGAGEGVLVLDPGPDDAGHVAAVLAVAGAPVRGILLSHSHHDHLGATQALREATGAPVHAWHEPAAPAFRPDVRLHDGDMAFGWRAVHTPGHAPDHVCFAGPGGIVFSADHVMSWSSSVVGPPGGNMGQYFASLHRMLARDDALYLPGHGPPLASPHGFVQDLLAHRQMREDAIIAVLGPAPQSARALMERLYSEINPALKRAAERNVIAHLLKLADEGKARDAGPGWVAS
jgi:glyoxylase-like metal-dependent hydrolase (beta-lactamase superfamily II)